MTEEAHVINSGAASGEGGARRSPSELAKQLQKTMLAIKGSFISADGKGVDYASIAGSELFQAYVSLSSELRNCDPSSLEENERKAFFINVYNALTIHGLSVADQLPTSVLDIAKFWRSTAYDIGGMVFSLDDIEHGILRGNKPHPSASDPPFSDKDPRKALALKSCDPRIHFTLVCGAKSCPAIQVYSAHNLERGLHSAATNFCSQQVGVASSSVSLSMIFRWYAVDFGSSDRELLQWLCPYLPDEKRHGLESLLSNQDAVTIEYTKYDWLLNKV